MPLGPHLEAKVAAHLSLPPPPDRRGIRVRAGLGQEDIAGELGVATETIGRWERGENGPRGDHLVRYAALLADLSNKAIQPHDAVDVPDDAPDLRGRPGAGRALLALLLDLAKTEGLIGADGRVCVPADDDVHVT